MSNCKHPKGFISNIGNYKICNLCGEKFFAGEEPKEEVKKVPFEAKVAEPPKAEIKPVEEPKVEVVEELIVEEKNEPKASKPRKKKNNKK